MFKTISKISISLIILAMSFGTASAWNLQDRPTGWYDPGNNTMIYGFRGDQVTFQDVYLTIYQESMPSYISVDGYQDSELHPSNNCDLLDGAFYPEGLDVGSYELYGNCPGLIDEEVEVYPNFDFVIHLTILPGVKP
ncbi:MAG: hypothetical protein HY918_03390 [Candidatus Doudnabacteria bacterium]|nr:hypothetical protein [Candidatus Doudnabacteria bacterium]